MKLHEFQGKNILEKEDFLVPKSLFIEKNDTIDTNSIPLEYPVIIKSQVLAGGRGKAGLVKKADSSQEFESLCKEIITKSHRGESPVGLLVEKCENFDKEFYVSLLINRSAQLPYFVFSTEGGVDIEAVAHESADKIFSFPYNQLSNSDVLQKLNTMVNDDEKLEKLLVFFSKLIQVFLKYDMTLLEMNPIVFTENNEISVLDIVIDIDESALYRQKYISKCLQRFQKKESEKQAKIADEVVKLEGNVGIIGCGAGLVMASMDMIRHFGGNAANFLDLGGGASEEKTIEALKYLSSLPQIKSIFINIFGGITDCELIAKAIINYRSNYNDSVPKVLRIMGNNAKTAIKLLKDNGFFAYDSMEKAAQKAVELAKRTEVPFNITRKSKVIVQGITGNYGSFHTKKMLDYGTNIIGGISPNKSGEIVHGKPVFSTVQEAKEKLDSIDASVIFVPAKFAKDAALQAIEADIPLIVIITEHIPVHDTMQVLDKAQKHGVQVLGPNCPGMISVNRSNIGIIPGELLKPGNVGIVSKSGTLLYEISSEISRTTTGVSSAIGLGGDPISGTSVIDAVEYFMKDDNTKYIVYIGEIGGGNDEETLAKKISQGKINKPVLAFFAGKSAPTGAKMGHAGAIIDGEKASILYKKKILQEVNCFVAEMPSDISRKIHELEEK